METKINSNYAIQILILHTVVFCVFLGIIIFKVYPSLISVEDQKKELLEKYTWYNKIVQQGLTYDEFIEEKNQDSNISEYLNDLIKAIPQSFYDKSIKNTSWGNFLDYMQSKISKIDKQKKDKLIEERDQKLESILPSYSSSISSIGGQENLTDFKFTNYVESILNAFSLTSNDSIWISDIIPVEDYADTSDTKKKQSSLDTNIFYIPLKLSVKWKKSDVIDFLYFIENVGTIKVDKSNQVSFYTDDTFKKNLPDSLESNIFENQIFDIEDLRMPTYLDSRLSWSDAPLVDYVRQTQGDDMIEMDLQLRFYIRWLPDYLVKKYIKDTLDTYDALSKELDKKVKELDAKQFTTSDEILLVNSVKALDYNLSKYASDVKSAKVSLSKSQDIDTLYRKCQEYVKVFTTIEETLDKVNKKLEINTNKK